MMTMNKTKKNLIKLLCVILALCTGLLGAAQIFAESQQEVHYLSDIKLFYASHGDDNAAQTAKKKCEAEGYTLLNKDLNSGTGEDWVYIGYKTTTNEDLAITDIRMLGMDKDYYLYDYAEILDYLKKSNVGTAQTLYNASVKVAENYKAGSPKAKDAYDGLNLFYVGNADTKLGDYIVDGKADINFFTEMVVKASTGTLNAVTNFLNTGIAPFENSDKIARLEEENDETSETTTEAATAEVTENGNTEITTVNWASAFTVSPLRATIAGELTTAQKNELHKQYNDDARVLFTQLQEFTTCYENALARNEDYEEGKLSDIIDADSKNSMDEAAENMEELQQEDSDSVYLAAMETLNEYSADESSKLGDWLVALGLQTSDEVDLMQLYPLVEAMGTEQVGMIGNTGFLSAISNLGENEQSASFADTLDKAKKAIYEYNKQDSISVWDSADDDMDDAYIAYTSDAVRKSNANNTIGQRTKFDIIEEKIFNVINWINLVSGALMVVVFVAQAAVQVTSTLAASAACATVAACCAKLAAGLALASTGLFVIGIAVIGFTIGWYIGKWIASLIRKVKPTIDHTNFPDYVFDVADTPSGAVTVRYKSARDEKDRVGDLNARQQSKWALLAYTTDKQVGSPIRADSDGNIFKVAYGNSGIQQGYDCVNFFGERSPANANYMTQKDNPGGIYISYRTQQSIDSEAPATEPVTAPAAEGGAEDGTQEDGTQQTETTEATNYISDIIVETAGDSATARAKISKKKGKYYLLDYNLSPDTNISTYIAYTMTTDPNDAITDLRIAPYHDNSNVSYGDIQYTFVGHVGVNVGDDSAQTQGDALLKTKDPNAGSPIPADGLHFVRNHSKAEAGWEPVTLFCGLPYNFNTQYEDLHSGIVASGYSTTSNNEWKNDGVYMYYEPTVKYTGGEKYLAGIYCMNGYDVSKTLAYTWAQTKGKLEHLKSELEEYPNATIYSRDIANSVRIDMASGHGSLRQYICYAYTYNPKRALYDIVAFQGDTYTDNLPYSISKKNAETKSVISYAACSTVCQQAPDMSNISKMPVSRFINQSNSIINSKAQLVMDDDYNEELMDGYTKTLPDGFRYGYSKSNFVPLGLYVSGYAKGKSPLRMDDVVITDGQHDGKEENGAITFDVTGEMTLDGNAASGAFHSVYEIKNPYSTTALNIAYPAWYTKKDTYKDDRPTYLYIRNAVKSAGIYIASVTVGAMSRDLYRRSLQASKEKVKDDDVNVIDPSVNLTAMVNAAGGCSDEMLYFNIGCAQGSAWYNRQSNGKAAASAPGNTPAAYIGVSRTDKASEAITGLLLYQNDDYPTANKIQIDGADYYCESSSAPIVMNGKQYYLYYTRNRGVQSGLPVKEISVDTEPMIAGCMTALCARAGENTTYAEADLPYYIHQRSDTGGADYYTGLYIGTGVNRKAALGDLVQQECPSFIDIDLNTGVVADSVYLGYSAGFLEPDADEEDIEDALYEAIYDIIITKNVPYQADGFVNEKNNIYYYPVSDVNLNNGGSADELYMYCCTPYTSAKYNRQQKKAKTGVVTALPEDVFTAPLSKLAFARYDRVPYNTSLAGTDETGNEVMKWEYIMYADHSRPADFTSGSHDFGSGGYIEDNRITMFAQRYDGSVKPAGEITGGFVDETMEVGTLSTN